MKKICTIEINNISKEFSGEEILNNINIKFFDNEIHSIIGENATGKSTILKILCGITKPDSGNIYYKGKIIKNYNQKKALECHVGAIYEEINLYDNLTVIENIYLNKYSYNKKLLFHYSQKLYNNYYNLINNIGIKLDPNKKVNQISIGEKRFLELAKLLSANPDIILLDEPTAFLNSEEKNAFFKIIKKLRSMGKTIIYISHKLNDLLEISDKITLISNNKSNTYNINDNVEEKQLLESLLTDSFNKKYPKLHYSKGMPIIKTINVCTKQLKNINFTLFESEILGFTGSINSHKSIIGKLFYGTEILDGKIIYNNKILNIKSPKDAIRKGIGIVFKDNNDNLNPNFYAYKNVTVSNLERISDKGLINNNLERLLTYRFFNSLMINTKNQCLNTGTLSAGIKQKISLAKLFFSNIKIMILEEPTKYLDSASKSDIYNIMNNYVAKGNSIILITSDLSELTGMADRVIVMNKGRIRKELVKDDITKENIIYYSNE